MRLPAQPIEAKPKPVQDLTCSDLNVTGNSNCENCAVNQLTCFKAYDIRGELGVNLDAGIAYRVGRAAARGVTEAGCNVLDIGLAGTDEMYWAVTEFADH